MTQVLKTFPPNYEEICKYIPAVKKNHNIVFTYGNTIYSPAGIEISRDLMAHEEAHIARQSNPKEWWDKYLLDVRFRLKEELIAYRTQYQYALKYYNREARRQLLSHIASDLSSAMYGSLITKQQARKLITETK